MSAVILAYYFIGIPIFFYIFFKLIGNIEGILTIKDICVIALLSVLPIAREVFYMAFFVNWDKVVWSKNGKE